MLPHAIHLSLLNDQSAGIDRSALVKPGTSPEKLKADIEKMVERALEDYAKWARKKEEGQVRLF